MRSEQLFELFGKIDDKYVSEALTDYSDELSEIKPVEIRVEKRRVSLLRIIALAAACLIIAAGTIRLVPGIGAVNSTLTSAEGSRGSLAQNNSADAVPIRFTDKDREIQGILSSMIEPADEIYRWIFDNPGEKSPEAAIRIRFSNYESKEYIYYLFSDDESDFVKKPCTFAEMKELMLDYFSAAITEKFMSKFGVCAAEYSDGTFILKPEDGKTSSFPPEFVEIEGKLYRCGGAPSKSIGIDVETVKIISETDDAIAFTYLPEEQSGREGKADNAACLNDAALYLDYSCYGKLKYERGGWKLDNWYNADQEILEFLPIMLP